MPFAYPSAIRASYARPGCAPLTCAEVQASPYLARRIRTQAGCIRGELLEKGEVWFAGRGYHRTEADVRDFAFRVLVAKGELRRDPADRRRYIREAL